MFRATFVMPRPTAEDEARRVVESHGGKLDRYEPHPCGHRAEVLFADHGSVYILAMVLSYPPVCVEPLEFGHRG